MRILITVAWGQRLGGAEAMLHGLLEGAAEGEHELEPVFFEEGPWPQELRDAGLRVEVIEAGRLRQAHRWLLAVVRLARLFRRRNPDVILNWSAKTQLYGSPAALVAGMSDRLVWWQHAMSRRSWLDACASILPAKAIGCASQVSARAQAKRFPRRPTFTVSPGSPIPPPRAAAPPVLADLGDGPPLVGLVGRLQAGKGQDRLLRAQRILLDRGHPIRTLIVGGDSYGLSPGYAASLLPLAAELGIADAVTMTGQVADAGPYIELMDVLVNASELEPFGIAIIEAMAREVAVVAVDSGGPSEFIEAGQNGVLARSASPTALADALQPLLESRELREQLARSGRERYLEEYTTAAMRDRFFAAMQRVAAET
jgi:glycosyltransferase involved in cell wall biosynthesis